MWVADVENVRTKPSFSEDAFHHIRPVCFANTIGVFCRDDDEGDEAAVVDEDDDDTAERKIRFVRGFTYGFTHISCCYSEVRWKEEQAVAGQRRGRNVIQSGASLVWIIKLCNAELRRLLQKKKVPHKRLAGTRTRGDEGVHQHAVNDAGRAARGLAGRGSKAP